MDLLIGLPNDGVTPRPADHHNHSAIGTRGPLRRANSASLLLIRSQTEPVPVLGHVLKMERSGFKHE